MMLPDMLLATYAQMLGASSAWLTKAEAQQPGGKGDALLAARLAPDMFPLSTQVRFACRQAQQGVFRLQGREFPASLQTLLEEGRKGGEAPGAMASAQGRVAATLVVVEAARAEGIVVDPTSTTAHALPIGMVLDVTAERYALDWAIPQFYFHIVPAYAILRARGIELGKADYAAHLLAHLRPPAT